jgi:fumarate reductase subunit D
MLLSFDDSDKSLSNLIEPLILGCLIPLGAIARVMVGDRVDGMRFSFALMVFFCLLAFSLWFFVPGLPE